MIGVKIGRGAGRGGSAPWGILGAWVGWCPPAPTTPRGVPWAGHGTARESHPKAAGCWSRASPTPASPGHRGGAAGGSPRAGSASRRFPRAGKSPKNLKSQIFTARTGFLWELGKGEHKQGQGCPQSIPGILQSPRALTAPRSHLHCPT